MKKKNVGSRVLCGVAIVMIVWMFISYCEVTTKNLDKNPKYSAWNFFAIAESMRTN